MKSLLALISVFAVGISIAHAEIEWTHKSEAGEDATSTFYHFYLSNGDSVTRVRSVWNGGAQNPPTVTEFIFVSGGIRIIHSVGTRAVVDDLVRGKDRDGLVVERDYVIRNFSSEVILLPPPPDTQLTDNQRRDLSHLIYLLAYDRKPIKK
jgi:hypothetical protein